MVAGITMFASPLPRRHRRRRRRRRSLDETGAPSQVMSRSASVKQTHPLRTDPRSDLSFIQHDVILTILLAIKFNILPVLPHSLEF